MKRFDVEIHHEYEVDGIDGVHEIRYLVQVDESETKVTTRETELNPTLEQVAAQKAMLKHMDEYFLDAGDMITIESVVETDMTDEEFLEEYGLDRFIC